MADRIRDQVEVLFRRGNTRVCGGSAGTAWAQSLDALVELLEVEEAVVHIAAWENLVESPSPGSLLGKSKLAMLSVTRNRLITQFAPDEDAIWLGWDGLTSVEFRGSLIPGQSHLYLQLADGSDAKLIMPRDVAEPLVESVKPLIAAGGAHAVSSSMAQRASGRETPIQGTKDRRLVKPTRAELEELYQKDNLEVKATFHREVPNLVRKGIGLAKERRDFHSLRKGLGQLLKEGGNVFPLANELAGAEEMYLDRVERELRDDESVSALISYISCESRLLQKHRTARALLVVTSQRVIHMSGRYAVLGWVDDAASQASNADDLDVIYVPHDHIAGITARMVILGAGMDRELHLHRKSGSFFKIEGMSKARSEIAEERIREALILH